jgi:hypothetical protein
MSLYSKIRGTIEALFQLGLGGPQLKNNAGNVEVRNPTDTAFVITRGADPIGPNDYVTKQSLGSLTGTQYIIQYAIGVGATQDSLTTIPANAIIMDTKVEITTPYSVGATINVGQPGNLTLLQLTTDNLPQAVGLYQTMQDVAWGAAALVVRATIGGAPVAGAGFVTVQYAIPNV